MILPPTRRAATPRRGMLLLLVLSILALFIVVGAVGILLALRARETARAFAAASASQTASGTLARVQLDEALLKLLRGPSQAAPPGTPARDVTESLLEDKYGEPQSITVTALSSATSTFITATVSGTALDLSKPTTVAGRVLTFVPAANDPTGPTSYRILRTGTVANTLLLANVKPNTPLPLPTVFPCEAVVNGREFVAEPYDAYDDQNRFLTQPVLQSSTVVSIARPAFGGTNSMCTVDNDGDGVPDGIWLDGVLPAQVSPNGGQLTFSVSYLVLDLDGRINLNAHGSFVRAQTVSSTSTYPKDPKTSPVGMGFGPADVDASLLVSTTAELTSGSVPARWALLLQGGTVSGSAAASTATQWRPAPEVETVQVGRYGYGPGTAQPGGSVITGTNPLHSDYWVQYTGTTTATSVPPNSPTDLKARLQVYTEGSPPTLKFARPTPAWAASDTDDVLGSGTAAHPYRMRLDEDAPRDPSRVGVGTASDALFTVGELERVLRQFDADASTLAPRLAAILDDRAEQSRMTVTTDSWDTPALTGNAAQTIAAVSGTLASGTSVYTVLSPETVAGLRFNLNRPLVSGSARQDYFKQLYTLVVSLTGTANADAAAQWAANVIEFRDPDSIMTWYPYDTNPLDGTWTTGTGVWGAERPEMVITQVAAKSGDKVEVTLQRPNWKAELVTGAAGTVSGTTELIDGSLGNRTANTLDATKVVVVSGSPAVWLLGGSTTSGTGLNTLLSSATAVGPNALVGTGTVTVTSGTVFLLRLADPTRGVVASNGPDRNDYVPVHSGNVPAVDATLNTGSPARWLHWPNRDLVSHGELLAVQSGSAADLAKVVLDASGASEKSLARSFPAILDATIVPSRFVGANVSVDCRTTNYLAGTGYADFQHSQFSRWREAGRVNVNTIVSNTGNSPATVDNAVWTAVVGRSGTANPVTASGTYAPIKSDGDLLVTGDDARFTRSGSDAASAFLTRSTAIRLANVATVRSHVFAVWITVRITDSSPNAGPPQFARLFAIVDRSIPVACARGRTLNARETIRLQRFLQ